MSSLRRLQLGLIRYLYKIFDERIMGVAVDDDDDGDDDDDDEHCCHHDP